MTPALAGSNKDSRTMQAHCDSRVEPMMEFQASCHNLPHLTATFKSLNIYSLNKKQPTIKPIIIQMHDKNVSLSSICAAFTAHFFNF
jgi:hypothetical protein